MVNMSKIREKAYLKAWIFTGIFAVILDLTGMSVLSVSTLAGMTWILACMHVGISAFAGMIFVPLDIFSLAGSFTGSVVFAGMLLCSVVFAGTHDGFL